MKKITQEIPLNLSQIQRNLENKISNPGGRTIKRKLIKKYKKHFTESEVQAMQKLSLDEINSLIDNKVGKFR